MHRPSYFVSLCTAIAKMFYTAVSVTLFSDVVSVWQYKAGVDQLSPPPRTKVDIYRYIDISYITFTLYQSFTPI